MHAGVAPEAVQAQPAAAGAGAGQLKYLAAQLHRCAVRQHLGFDHRDRHLAALLGGDRSAQRQRFIDAPRRQIGHHLGGPQQQAQFAIAVLDEGVVHGPGNTRSRPGARLLPRVGQTLGQHTLGDAGVEIGQHQLGQLRAQRGAHADRGARAQQHLMRLDVHVVEMHGAAVGLALAKGVPVGFDAQAGSVAGRGGNQQALGRLMPGRQRQPVRTNRARAIALGPLHHKAVALGHGQRALVVGVQRIAPEQPVAHRHAQQGLGVRRLAVQHQRRHLQMVEGVDMGQRAVGLGQDAHGAEDGLPVQTRATATARRAECQQAAGTYQRPFGGRMAAGAVAFHGGLRQGLGELRRHLFGVQACNGGGVQIHVHRVTCQGMARAR